MIEKNLLKDYQPNDLDSIKICILNILEANLDSLDFEQIIRDLHELSGEAISTLKKYYKEEKLKIDNYKKTSTTNILPFFADKIDLAKKYYEMQPFFYDRKRIWWFWNIKESKYEQTDETNLLIQIDQVSPHNTVKNMEKSEIIESLKQVGRLKIPLETPKEWVQFKNSVYDIKITTFNPEPIKVPLIANHEYFMTNPIPWKIGDNSDTPILDKLFSQWVAPEHISTLYELIAYCCYPSYPIQLIFSLWGNGSNGKSQFLKILNKFIGRENITSTELDVLTTNRFESFKLYKKLVCTIGETNFGILSQTSLIKKLTGGDLIGFEKKNKDPFDDYNYAKIIISSNSLPSSEDTSDGFYRRWLIVEFPNEFKDTGQEVYESIPDSEFEALAHKVVLILPELLKRGTFTGQGDLQLRKQKYISVSNPLSLFIKEKCKVDINSFVLYNKLYTEYVKYLSIHKRRKVKMKEFKSALEDEGFYLEKKSPKVGIDEQGYSIYQPGYYIVGIDLNNLDKLDTLPTPSLHVSNRYETLSNLSNLSNDFNVRDLPVIFQRCSLCDLDSGENLLYENKVLCPICLNNLLFNSGEVDVV